MSTQENQNARSLITRQRVPFEKEVLKFLLTHEASITNAALRDFVRRYVKWLYDCSNQEAPIVPGGGVELVRWTTKEGGNYGYKPGDIAYCLLKLNQLFFTVMGNAYIRLTQQDMVEELPPLNTQLSIELLKGLSPALGFYVLITYLAAGATLPDQAWVRRACDLFGEFGDLETWRPERAIETSVFVLRILGSTQSPDDPYYNDLFPKNIRAPEPQSYKLGKIPDVQLTSGYKNSVGDVNSNGQHYQYGYSHGYTSGHAAGYQQCVNETNRQFSKAAFIVECERKRLVDFIRSLRQALDVLNEDPLLVEGEWQVVTPDEKTANGYQANTQDEK